VTSVATNESVTGKESLLTKNLSWLIALAGFMVMYVPVYIWASKTIWQTEDQGHGAIILAVLIWLFWEARKKIAAADGPPALKTGWVTFAIGILIYAIGRLFSISIFEMGSQIFIVSAILLLLQGVNAWKLCWFPVIYILFMIPLPSVLVDAITGSLKQVISDLVTSLLYTAGYPIARSGVMLTIGQYQLLVADACSGLHSMFSLSALGTLFMYIMARKSLLHNSIMLMSILPIAFVANICRVIVLVLVTYYLGDEAGQGFLHGAAGMVLMLTALVIFFALDKFISMFISDEENIQAIQTPITEGPK
jgi:exosortase B